MLKKRLLSRRPVQQAAPGRLGLILCGLNGLTCWTVLAHLKDGPSRAGPWTPTAWPGMAHKPGGLAVPTSRVGRAVLVGRAGGPCRRALPTGRAGRLAHIKFYFVKKKLYLIYGNANFLFLKPRKNILYIYIYIYIYICFSK